MLASLKSELRKLLTIRSTYVIVVICLLLSAFVTYISTGELIDYEQIGGSVITEEQPDGTIVEYLDPNNPGEMRVNKTVVQPDGKQLINIESMLPIVVTLGAVLLTLFMAHEFRYNTINYTLTSSPSRLRVLASKLVVGSIYMVVLSALSIAVILATTYLAVSIKGLQFSEAEFGWIYALGRYLLYAVGTGAMALAIAAIVKSLTMAVASVLILPMIDSLVGAILMGTRDIEPSKVMPFASRDRLGSVVTDALGQGAPPSFFGPEGMQATTLMALAVFGAYLLGVWIIASILFVKRDAN